jgi:HK97 gp10 family phage protein
MSDFNNQLNDALKKVDLWGGRVHDALGQALINGALIVEGAAKQNASSDTGHLRQSITESPIQEKNNEVSIQVGPTVGYGPHVEFGTSPHTNSEGSEDFVASITQWGQRKGMDHVEIGALIEHIRKYGTKPHPFLGPAYYLNIEKIKQEIAQALGKA